MAAFYRRLAHPVLTDLEIDWKGLPVDDVVPARIPDLFTGQPVVVYGRMRGVRSGTATLRARAGDREGEIPIRIDVADARRTGGVASMWARRKIQEHEDSLIGDPGGAEQVERAVTELALRHHVMSKYTSFVAIDESRVVQSDGGLTVVAAGGRTVEVAAASTPGTSVRLAIRPEDVTLEPPGGDGRRTSARNALDGVIARVVPSTHAVHITVDVGFPLVAAVTARSAAELGLAPGTRVCAVFKASAVYLIGHAAPA